MIGRSGPASRLSEAALPRRLPSPKGREVKKQMTSAELNKNLKKLQHERSRILETEQMTALFVAATTEKVEEIRPEYDLAATDEALAGIEKEIRRIKHRLNVFNSTHMIEEIGMTVDEALVYLPQQSERVEKLAKLAGHTLRQRVADRYGSKSSLIEYEYANYDRALAQRLYEEAQNALSRVQLALDRTNTAVDIP